jgi:hypothetical protein
MRNEGDSVLSPPHSSLTFPCNISCTFCRCHKGRDRSDLFWDEPGGAWRDGKASALGGSLGLGERRVLQEKVGSG